MSKYINADELIKFCTSMLVEAKDDEIIQTHNNAFRRMREHIKSLSAADVVEVVRCKDCNNSYIAEDGNRICKQDEYTGIIVTDNDFCSYAERRKANDTATAGT